MLHFFDRIIIVVVKLLSRSIYTEKHSQFTHMKEGTAQDSIFHLAQFIAGSLLTLQTCYLAHLYFNLI